MVITVDHYIETFPFDRVLSPIDRYRFELTQLVTEIPFFIIIIIISNIKKTGIHVVCFRFNRRTPGLGDSNVCAAIVPFFSITFVSVCQLSPSWAIICVPLPLLFFTRILQLFKPLT